MGAGKENEHNKQQAERDERHRCRTQMKPDRQTDRQIDGQVNE